MVFHFSELEQGLMSTLLLAELVKRQVKVNVSVTEQESDQSQERVGVFKMNTIRK